jgi:pyrroline-5-carboxylate reductase
MGGAVLKGLIAAGHPKELISATTKSEISAIAWRDLGISALSTEVASDANALMAGDADLIVLGVKPKQIVDVLGELVGEIGRNAVVISMAAGIELSAMAKVIENPNMIRTMPNTPALVGMGVTGLASASTASKAAVDAAVQLFEAVGEVVVTSEDKINALSAISGSGPAWLFYIIEQWEAVAQANGFSEADAKRLALAKDIAELDAGRIGRDRSRIVAVVLGGFVVSVGVGVLFMFFSPVVTRDWEKLNAQILDLLKSIVLPLVTLVFGYYFGKADK